MSILEQLIKENGLIKLDYPYHTRSRPLNMSKSKVLDLIGTGTESYIALLEQFANFSADFEKIAVRDDVPESFSPRWVNGWFPGLDSISLYGLLALNNPRLYVEIGSGNSTMFARQAIRDHGLRTSIVSIDPFPRANIDSICDRVIRSPCEDVPADFFESLGGEDILFVDNSHRSFTNSDVTVFFTEILPYLPSRMIYGIHDIFLPWDYPEDWKGRFYNEQYLLAAYLLGGAAGDTILLPNAYMTRFSPGLLGPLDSVLKNPALAGIESSGGAFWMQRA
jgi:Methyltransferase domain